MPFNINKTAATSLAVATKLSFSVQPVDALYSSPITPSGGIRVNVQDSLGLPVSFANLAVTLSIANDAGPGGALTGTQTVNAINGVATFTGLNIATLGNGYTLSASASGLTSATSTGFSVVDLPSAGPNASINLNANPSSSYQFTASSGKPAYQYQFAGTGGTVDSTTGTFTSSGHRGSGLLTVQDSLGNNSSSISVKSIPIRVNGTVNTIVQSGSSLYIGGSFTSFNPNILPAFGAIDTTSAALTSSRCNYEQGVTGTVLAVAYASGSIYIGGVLTAYQNSPVQNLIKVDAITCRLDTSFTQATGFNGNVGSVVALGTSIYVGGAFTSYRSAPANYVAKLDSTSGMLDTVFTQATGFNSTVNSLSMDSSALYVGGGFTTYQGASANKIAKLDLTSGALDTGFTQATAFNGTINTLLYNAGNIYAGGQYSTYRGTAAYRIAKLDSTTGNLDGAFTSGTGFNNPVYALSLSGTALYVGGQFQTYKGTQARGVAKLSIVDGSLDTTFTQSAAFLNNGTPTVYSLKNDGAALYVGGSFNYYRGTAIQNLAKLDLTSGNLDATFAAAAKTDSQVRTLVLNGSTLYLGGLFNLYGGTPAQNLAKMDSVTGALDTSFTQSVGMNNTVLSLALNGSNLLVGGSFVTYRGFPALYLAKLDAASGALDTTFNTATGLNGSVKTLDVTSSAVFVGGLFSDYQGTSVSTLVKINLVDGSLDTTFGTTGPFGSVYAIVVNGSSVYVGGSFGTYRSASVENLIKVDAGTGALDTTFTQSSGAPGGVNALAAKNTSLYVGGNFTSYRGTGVQNIAKVALSDGTLDTSFSQAVGLDGTVSALSAGATELYAVGLFANYRGTAAASLAAVDLTSGALDTAFTPTTPLANLVGAPQPSCIAINGPSVWVGGGFVNYSTQYTPYLTSFSASGQLND